MHSKKICGFLIATYMTGAAFAQQGPPKPQFLQQPDKTVTSFSAADVQALIAKAKKERTNDAPLVVGKMLSLSPYTVYLEYREPSKLTGDVGVHGHDDELVYIVEGSGTLVTGGTPAEDRMSITGGETQKIAKGDFVLIPAGTPHWINHVDTTIALMTIHLPHPPAAK